MTNQQFTDYILAKRDALAAEIKRNQDQKDIAAQVLSESTIQGMKEQIKMLTDALRIMTHSPGPARRRFRRDYERRMGL